VAGGINGLENGFSLMVGGDNEAYDYIKSVLDSLAQPYGCHTFFGPGGAGHYVKMVHNAIEYGMMQALGEGFGLLVKNDFQLNLLDVANTWQQGSIIEGFLLQMVIDAMEKDPGLEQTEGIIDATGEAKWAIEEAKEKHVAMPITEQSLQYRMQSQIDKGVQEAFTAKLIQAMRKEFGGHETKKLPEPLP
jgi:6-phosphogluconate dehydrogenase